MSIIHERHDAILTLLAEVRATKTEEQKESEAFVARIKQALVRLSSRPDLFPVASFPIKLDTHAGLYRLGEEADRQNALYITGGIYGKKQTQPHTHPAWVAMGGVKGLERNHVYHRTDDASVAGEGRLELHEIVDVTPETAAFIGSGLFHTLEVEDDIQSLHFHLYDVGLDHDSNSNLPVFEAPDSSRYTNTPAAAQRRVTAGVHPSTFGEVSAALQSGRPVQVITVDHRDPLLEKIVVPLALSLDDWEAGVAGLAPSAEVPVVLAGEVKAVELAAQRLARLGYTYFTHLR